MDTKKGLLLSNNWDFVCGNTVRIRVRMGTLLLSDSIEKMVNSRVDNNFAVLESVFSTFHSDSMVLFLNYDFYYDTDLKGIESKIQHFAEHVSLEFEKIFPYDLRWNFASSQEDFKLVFVFRDKVMKELKELFDEVSTLKDLAHLKLQGKYSPKSIEIFRQLTEPVFGC